MDPRTLPCSARSVSLLANQEHLLHFPTRRRDMDDGLHHQRLKCSSHLLRRRRGREQVTLRIPSGCSYFQSDRSHNSVRGCEGLRSCFCLTPSRPLYHQKLWNPSRALLKPMPCLDVHLLAFRASCSSSTVTITYTICPAAISAKTWVLPRRPPRPLLRLPLGQAQAISTTTFTSVVSRTTARTASCPGTQFSNSRK